MTPPRWLVLGVLALCCFTSHAKDLSNKVSPSEQPLPAEYEDLGTNPGAEEEEYQGVRGRAGVDFPMLQRIPKTKFSCRHVKSSGYFADLETGCQVFHLCEGGRKMSFLCPNGTIFLQSKLTCDWWYKVDCQSSEEFYESSAEQLRHDRAGSKGLSPTTTLRAQSRADDDDVTEASATFRPIRVKPFLTPESNAHQAPWFESTTLKFGEESQELAETGSYIIARHREEAARSRHATQRNSITTQRNKLTTQRNRLTTQRNSITTQQVTETTTPPITTYHPQDVTTQEPVTETIVVPQRRLELPARPATTEIYDTTSVQTTTEAAATESLVASHSSWYTGSPTNTPLQERQTSFVTVPDTTLLPPTTTPGNYFTSGYSARAAPSEGYTLVSDAATEGYPRVSSPAKQLPRPRLNEIPLSSSPQTLHSLARYFAADNQTRQQLEKDVPAGTMELMASLMPTMETTTANLDTLSPDLRQLAQIFSKALADYLQDPETFRQSLTAVRPTHPPPTQNLVDDDRDEVLDFSDSFNTKKQRKSSTTPTPTTEVPETTTSYPVTTERTNKNEVASIVNEILQDPTDISPRRIPSNDNTLPTDAAVTIPDDSSQLQNEETQYRLPSTPRDINLLTYLPAESTYSTTTAKPLDSNFVESIPQSTTAYPYTPEPIPLIPADELTYPRYVEIGYPKSRVSSTTPRTFYSSEINSNNFQPPSLDSVLSHFAPHDLNSLAIFSLQTNPSPSPLAPISVAVHLPTQSSNLRHHVTVLTSTHNDKAAVTTYRPMISKLLFPLPTVQADTLERGESLLSENTASFPASFRHAQNILQNTNQDYLKSWINEDKSVSQLITEQIPTTQSPATTSEPVTEAIPQDTTTQEVTTTEQVPTARKVAEDPGSKLVLLLVKNGATTEAAPEPISRTRLLEALLLNSASRNATSQEQSSTSIDVSTSTLSVTTPGQHSPSPVPVTTPGQHSPPSFTKQPEITTYRSAHHQKILEKVHSSAETEELPRPQALVQSESQLQNITVANSKLALANSTHSDSRAFNILKSLYSLASRWGK